MKEEQVCQECDNEIERDRRNGGWRHREQLMNYDGHDASPRVPVDEGVEA
jgi:hypothetical protein